MDRPLFGSYCYIAAWLAILQLDINAQCSKAGPKNRYLAPKKPTMLLIGVIKGVNQMGCFKMGASARAEKGRAGEGWPERGGKKGVRKWGWGGVGG